MGCCTSSVQATQRIPSNGAHASAVEKIQNMDIERGQHKAIEEASRKIHLMILGTGDSGKTTIRKQLININTHQFETVAYREQFASTILSNLVDGALEVLSAMDEAREEDKIKIAQIRDLARTCNKVMGADLAVVLQQTIWEDPRFQATLHLKKGHDIQVQDCFFVYAQELKTYPAWGGPDWVPSVDDCIRARVRTSGVIKEDVTIDKLPMVIYDVGGQRSERRKWMHMFDNVSACIFVAAISEYDQVLYEERAKNRLEESLELFADCVNSTWLKNVTMILFLNKKDLFLQKFKEDKIPLNVSGLFPNAPADNTDPEAAIAWVSQQFRAKKVHGKGKIHVHVTTATDPQNVRKVFNVCKEIILQTNLHAAGFAL